MDTLCLLPSPGPYHYVDYVVAIHFNWSDVDGDSDDSPEPCIVHIMRTDTSRKEFAVTTLTRSTCTHISPEDTYHVPSSQVTAFLVQYLYPSVLGARTWLGTNCRSTFRYLRRVGLQQTVFMSVGIAPHFSSNLRILTMYCKVKKDRELHEMHEAWKKKKCTTVENVSESPSTASLPPPSRPNAVAASAHNNILVGQENVDWRNAQAHRVSSTAS
ncbi:hypothetical protein JTE90_010183, partial [Oedothorax gibbosus]